MRIFLDTNVLVSGLMGRGLCKDLLSLVVIEHSVVLGAPVRDELRGVLLKNFGFLKYSGARLMAGWPNLNKHRRR